MAAVTCYTFEAFSIFYMLNTTTAAGRRLSTFHIPFTNIICEHLLLF